MRPKPVPSPENKRRGRKEGENMGKSALQESTEAREYVFKSKLFKCKNCGLSFMRLKRTACPRCKSKDVEESASFKKPVCGHSFVALVIVQGKAIPVCSQCAETINNFQDYKCSDIPGIFKLK
jgi:hypothetical protein